MNNDTIYPNLVLDALRTVRYPGTGKDIVSEGMVADDIRIDGRRVSFSIVFEKNTDPFARSVVRAAEAAILTHIGDDVDIKGNIAIATKAPASKAPAPVLPGVRNIIGVASGKGGVGKSTVAANLAVSLAREGYKVGVLDADIFGPSMPKIFGVEDQQLYMRTDDACQNLIIPAENYGVKLLSIGFLVERDSAVLWRGSMASTALRQLITQGDWGDLDYFVIDMPPGTSDIHLTLVQTLPITGVVIVSTPQQIALADARKGIAMFRGDKVDVPVLGIVENMAWFTPEQHPDERYYIFGNGGAVDLAKELDIPLLAQIPLVASVGQHNDDGTPVAAGDGLGAQAFMHLAHEVTDAVERRNATLPPTHIVQVKH